MYRVDRMFMGEDGHWKEVSQSHYASKNAAIAEAKRTAENGFWHATVIEETPIFDTRTRN